jgi:hypothetical protein
VNTCPVPESGVSSRAAGIRSALVFIRLIYLSMIRLFAWLVLRVGFQNGA